MNLDILELLNSTLGGPFIRQASTYLGEPEDSTRAAVRSVGPAMLAGLLQQAAAPNGLTEIFRSLTDERVDSGIAGKLAAHFGNRGSLESLLNSGESLGGTLFGSRMGNVSNAISEVSGVRPNSALALLSMGVPLLFGVLKKYIMQNGLNPSGLAQLLRSQGRSLENSGLDRRIIGALGAGSFSELLAAVQAPGTTRSHAKVAPIGRSANRDWLPWAIAAGIALLGVLFFVNRTADRQELTTAQAPASDDDPLKLASASTKVYFAVGDASLHPRDRQRLASLAQAAKDRSLAITGYTDHTGDRALNLELAKDRAYAVRDALVDAGVAEERIVMDPPAFVVGADDDDEARRVEIAVR
ncbi:MAG TPA: OmpA family protein [Povalibacter sp.]|nr:OmpA family protein [Povalibacter sp.]